MAKVPEFTSLEEDVFNILGNRIKNITKEEKLEMIKELDSDKINMVDKKGNTILYYSVVMDLIDIIKYLLSCPNIDINKSSRSLLHAAELHTDKTILRLLLTNPNIDVNTRDEYNYTILRWLVSDDEEEMKENIEIIKMILEFPDVEILNNLSKYESPMEDAKIFGYMEVIKMFEEYLERN